ncbi:MAG: hypothetical protein A3J93_05255 [Candidatus Magasanikbacteria bacterium RIFOXYC2_FULL_42_28]|uniref:Fibronectin type-III domain-containing protein n=1 Tax=Candidatus Magasanikbacteria bacterium RIFOXYC2_FULL_42_28 TaxID=1798704 RepID=A0A1F6NV60_9BACT|nr:MAG: hypothetical protein A3J93_05255 [Candidatus Magasanikbacteria bacterium RIFOXYC2_FULL_42_28]
MFSPKKIFFTILTAVLAVGLSTASLVLAETQTGGLTVGVTIGSDAVCGNGAVEGDEACDAGSSNGLCSATCSTSCTVKATTDCGGGGDTDNSPTISNVTTTLITVNSATVSWNATDNNGISTSTFVYGIDINYGSSATISGSNPYSVNLFGLSANTVYYFQISVTDTGSHTVESTGSFTTLSTAVGDTIPPNIFNVIVSPIGVTMATISFDTNELTTAQIKFSSDFSYASSTALDAVLATTHTISVLGLWPDTTYHFQIIANDEPNNTTTTLDATFTTLPAPAVADVGHFELSPSFEAITLSWDLPDSPYYDHIILNRQVTGDPATLVELPVDPLDSLFIDYGIDFNINYTYTIYVVDIFDQQSQGVSVNGEVLAFGLEDCDNGDVDDDGDGDADCGDLDSCFSHPHCVIEEVCHDENGDGLENCDDPSCAGNAVCLALHEDEICGNLFNDNGDDFESDCEDPDCAGFPDPQCVLFDVVACSDQQDNDGDGQIDFGNDTGCVSAGDNDESDDTVPSFLQLNVNDIKFFAGNRQIPLAPVNEVVSSLAGSNFTVAVAPAITPQAVTLVLEGATYQFGFNAVDNIYYSDFTLPFVGVHSAYLNIDYGNGQQDSVLIKINCLPWGQVESGGELIAGVEMFLLDTNNEKIYLGEYGQTNPVLTSASGLYGWSVLPGHYLVRANKEGFYERTVQIYEVKNNSINANIDLIKMPTNWLGAIDAARGLALQAVNDVADNPAVEQVAQQVVAPVAVGVSAVGTILVVPWWNLLALLRFLFLQPLLLIGRGKRKQWGMVYNSLSKMPIDLAIVRLFDATTGKLLRSRVTDEHGRYAFIMPPGKYRLQVVKMNMTFPSVLLAGITHDGNRPDIYHGEEIIVNEKNVLITANVPLDPSGDGKTPKRILRERFWRKVQSGVSGLGLVFTLVALYISPRWYMWVLAGAHIGLMLVFRRLAKPKTAKGWGIVSDTVTSKPVGRTVARLFDTKFNKLVATEVTDKHGRYNFLAGDNKYYVTYEHENYETTKTDVLDLTGKEEDAIATDAKLKKKDLSTE